MSEIDREELLHDAILGELDDEGRLRLEAELSASRDLRAEYEQMQEMWAQFGQLLDADEPKLLRTSARVRPGLRWMVAVAASALLFFALGRWSAGTEVDTVTSSMPQFALLLYAGGTEGDAPANENLTMRVVQEHMDWAEQLRADRTHVLSEKLADASGIDLLSRDGRIDRLPESPLTDPLRLGGLYIIQAADLSAATRIAEECPLLDYGGVVRVRQIETLAGPQGGSS